MAPPVSFGAPYQARAEYPESAESGVYAGEVHHGKRGFFERLAALVARPGFGTFALIVLLAAAGWAGFVDGGGYRELVTEGGQPQDMIARGLGFPISAVTISGENRLREGEIVGGGSHRPAGIVAVSRRGGGARSPLGTRRS